MVGYRSQQKVPFGGLALAKPLCLLQSTITYIGGVGNPKSSNLGPIGFLKKGNILEIKFSNAFQDVPGRPDWIKKEYENEHNWRPR